MARRRATRSTRWPQPTGNGRSCPVHDLYRDLKAYQQQPDPACKVGLEARFDALSAQQTDYPSINGVLKEMRDHNYINST